MNKKFIYGGIGASALVLGIATYSLKEKPETKITEIKQEASIIIEETGHKINKILEINNLCENGEEIILNNKKINDTSIVIKYQCKEKTTKLNGVNQLPAIPGIPTGTPLPF